MKFLSETIIGKGLIYEQLAKVAAEVFNVSLAEINKDAEVGMFEGWDSLGHLKLFMAIEEKMKVKFTTDEIVELSSLSKIQSNIEWKLSKATE
jgi:acyl carrier protein